MERRLMACSDLDASIAARADVLFHEYRRRLYERTDRLFAGLMLFQWVGGVVAALVISPFAWEGSRSQTHVHVWVAILLGGAITIFPVMLGLVRPGRVSTRHTIAVSQMLMSGLLIHLTGGRIETHFHVFGSLAFLGFYRDWKIFGPATLVVALDHFLRGMYWPESAYGVTSAPWRWLEHASLGAVRGRVPRRRLLAERARDARHRPSASAARAGRTRRPSGPCARERPSCGRARRYSAP